MPTEQENGVQENAAIIEIAKNHNGSRGENVPIVLSTGVLALVIPVSASLLDEAMSSVPVPKVPLFKREDGIEIENPDHPEYKQAVERAEVQRNMRSIDAMIMFGVILVDEDGNPTGAPADDGWIKKLRFMEKRGMVNLGDVDLKDEMEREFIYKKYIAVGAPDIFTITRKVGISEEEVQNALDSFRDQKERRANTKGKSVRRR